MVWGHKSELSFHHSLSHVWLQAFKPEELPPALRKNQKAKMRPKVTKTKITIQVGKVDTSWTLHLHESFKKGRISLSRAPNQRPVEMVEKQKQVRESC